MARPHIFVTLRHPLWTGRATLWEAAIAWTTPVIEEICIGMEINGYFPAEI